MTAPAIWTKMLAEMYGMMPSANTVARDSCAAGEQVVQAEQPAASLVLEEVASAPATSTPGAVMCAPIR